MCCVCIGFSCHFQVTKYFEKASKSLKLNEIFVLFSLLCWFFIPFSWQQKFLNAPKYWKYETILIWFLLSFLSHKYWNFRNSNVEKDWGYRKILSFYNWTVITGLQISELVGEDMNREMVGWMAWGLAPLCWKYVGATGQRRKMVIFNVLLIFLLAYLLSFLWTSLVQTN